MLETKSNAIVISHEKTIGMCHSGQNKHIRGKMKSE